MREFSKVSPQLWGKRKFRALSSEAKLGMLYFLTCRHQTSAGCYQVPDAYAAADLGWNVETYVAVRDEIERAGMIVFDVETSEIYIRGWFEENPVTNDKHFQGCQRIVFQMESEIVGNIADEELQESQGKWQTSRAARQRKEEAF